VGVYERGFRKVMNTRRKAVRRLGQLKRWDVGLGPTNFHFQQWQNQGGVHDFSKPPYVPCRETGGSVPRQGSPHGFDEATASPPWRKASLSLFGAQFRPSCQPSGRPAWVQRRKGRAACFETQPSHSPPSRELKFVHLDVAAPAALSLIASVSNRASYHYCRPPREGGDEETLFGGIPLRPAREAHDAQGKSPMKQF